MGFHGQSANADWASICDVEYRNERWLVAFDRGSWVLLGLCVVGLAVVCVALLVRAFA